MDMTHKICTTCKQKNRPGSNFCTYCGARLLKKEEQRSCLRIIHGDPKGATFLLAPRRNTIGRDGANVIVLGDEQISNKHAVIVFESGNYWVQDLQSKNGVMVNGSRIKSRAPLFHHSVLEIGSTILRFEMSSS
jgi:pSer/pThr/pTyr-binding forkhead associated (FHA) protein